ncbi:MAG: pseudoazurin [Pseudomonadota bacterium]
MRMTRRENLNLLGSAMVTTSLAGASTALANDQAGAKTIEVQLLNAHPEDRGERMVFYPDIVRANPGDTIRFVPTERGHNVAADAEMIPDGVEPWRSGMNEEFEITLDVEGAYGVYCTPHKTAGMVGLIIVGDNPPNFEQARQVRQRGRAKNRYEDIFARAEELIAGQSTG